eukprot:gene9688-biopygen8606
MGLTLLTASRNRIHTLHYKKKTVENKDGGKRETSYPASQTGADLQRMAAMVGFLFDCDERESCTAMRHRHDAETDEQSNPTIPALGDYDIPTSSRRKETTAENARTAGASGAAKRAPAERARPARARRAPAARERRAKRAAARPARGGRAKPSTRSRAASGSSQRVFRSPGVGAATLGGTHQTLLGAYPGSDRGIGGPTGAPVELAAVSSSPSGVSCSPSGVSCSPSGANVTSK